MNASTMRQCVFKSTNVDMQSYRSAMTCARVEEDGVYEAGENRGQVVLALPMAYSSWYTSSANLASVPQTSVTKKVAKSD